MFPDDDPKFMENSHWTTERKRPFLVPETMHRLEGRALLYGLESVANGGSLCGSRLLMCSDSLVCVSSGTSARSKDFSFLVTLRKIAAVC